MGSVPAELSLDLRPTFVPKTISDFFYDVSKIANASERFLRVNDFLTRLQEEMGKIDAFKRELPLCMNLLNDAILAVSEESTKCRPANSQPVLEEFIPLKKECDLNEEIKKEKECKDKKSWMSSVQLWNTSNYTRANNANGQTQHFNVENKKFEEEEEKSVAKNSFQSCRNRNEGRGFMPLTAHSAVPVIAVTTKKEKEEPAIDGLSLRTPGMPNLREGSTSTGSRSSSNGGVSSPPPGVQPNSRITTQHQSGRKQRRCWSPELHRRFVNALQQLGGSQAATPKQIRELMQVDGLSNDEVKSHLQKYRLHTRRIPPSSAAAANQPVVVLGGLWMSQDHYNESSKAGNSGSPQGPLQLTASGRGSSPNSMEDDEDEKSESHSWKKHIHRHGTDDV